MPYTNIQLINCPIIHGLSCMLDICYQFAFYNFITFNSKKTVCIKFGESLQDNECVKFEH